VLVLEQERQEAVVLVPADSLRGAVRRTPRVADELGVQVRLVGERGVEEPARRVERDEQLQQQPVRFGQREERPDQVEQLVRLPRPDPVPDQLEESDLVGGSVQGPVEGVRAGRVVGRGQVDDRELGKLQAGWVGMASATTMISAIDGGIIPLRTYCRTAGSCWSGRSELTSKRSNCTHDAEPSRSPTR
jgi:hypothetical protein